jgi:hypothetical protein
MTITIDLQPDVERGLLAHAAARGLSLIDYVQDMFAREAGAAAPTAHGRTGQELVDAGAARAAQAANLIELFEPVRGLLTDEEVDTLFTRNPSSGRPVDLG